MPMPIPIPLDTMPGEFSAIVERDEPYLPEEARESKPAIARRTTCNRAASSGVSEVSR